MPKALFAFIHVILCQVLYAIGLAPGQLSWKHLPGNASESTVSLWMIALSAKESYGTYNGPIGASTDETYFEFAIQTGFDGTDGSVAIHDGITFQGRDYRIMEIDQDQSGAIFKCKAQAKTARVL